MSYDNSENDNISLDLVDEDSPDNFYIDILTGHPETPSPKKLLVQKVLRQLIETYGFDRNDLEVNYNLRINGRRKKLIDIAIFRPGAEHISVNIQRVILCKYQKKRDKLRTITEAASDLESLKGLLELIPDASLGLWTNGHEEFFLQVEHTRFETRTKPLGIWPVPGEPTTALDHTGGVIQVGADAEDLIEALLRCRKYLGNQGLDPNESFKQLAVLMLAKIYDETLPIGERNFWIKGDEPFTTDGQQAIAKRINESIIASKVWQPNLLAIGWNLHLEPHQTARVVQELARYSLSQTQPSYRIEAFRAAIHKVMSGNEGRYPTPLNVAEMAVNMLNPQTDERILDCSCGTGTFLAMTGAHIFNQKLAQLGTTLEEAAPEQIKQAQDDTAAWVASNALGCEIDPYLAVTSRMNLLFTTGNPGRIFRIDARDFPNGELDGIEAARTAIPLGSIDIVILNPWFSTQDKVSDQSILKHYDLGHIWERDEEGGFRNTGRLNEGGVPPEVLFLERALHWVKPGTGRVGILLPDGVLGNPGDEYIRSWILRNCEVMASVDLPIEPFKVTVKDYSLTPALPSLLILRKRSKEEIKHSQHPEYKVFMAVVDKARVDARGNILYQRAPDGEEIIFTENVIERIRQGNNIITRRTTRRDRRIRDELPIVAGKFKEFCETGDVSM